MGCARRQDYGQHRVPGVDGIGPRMATATASHPNNASILARGAAIPAVRDAARRLARAPEDLDGVLAVNCGAVDGGCP